MLLDRALHRLGLAQHECRQSGEYCAQRHQQQAEPPVEHQRERQQHQERYECGEVIAEEGDPQRPQRIGSLQHHLHQPTGMDVAVEGERQFQHVLEISGEHGVTPAMGEAVGIECDERAAEDVEYSEADPDQQQRDQLRPDRGRVGGLRIGERVDHASEQHRLGELSRRKRDVGAAEHPGEVLLRPQQSQHASIESNELHSAACLRFALRPIRMGHRQRGRARRLRRLASARSRTSRAPPGRRSSISLRS